MWLTLGERTLRYEAYVMPAPEENAEKLYEQLVASKRTTRGYPLCDRHRRCSVSSWRIAAVGAAEAELDRLIGSLFATIEQCYQGLLRIGFASRFP